MPKHALICGISGQDGAYLAKLLLDKGYQVTGTSRDAQVASFRNLQRLGIRDRIRCVSMTLKDFRSVLQVLNETMPDEIFNLSGQSSVGLSFEQPVETLESIAYGSLNLLEVLRFMRMKTRLYNAASGECYGDVTPDMPATEDSLFRPRSPYAVAKATAFWQVANYREAYGLFACSGLLFNHESPLRPVRFVTRKVVSAAHRIAKGSPERLTLGNLSIIRDWGWAPEYVEAMWAMLQRDTPRDYVIATGHSQSLKAFVASCFEQVGLDWQEHVDFDASLLRATEIAANYADPSRAAQELRWQANTTLNDVVDRLMQCEASGDPFGVQSIAASA